MTQQFVALSIINKALNISELTPLQSTLVHIHELTAFRKTHELCNNIIFTLRDQLAKLNLQIAAQTHQYLTSKLALAKEQSRQIFRTQGDEVRLADVKIKGYPEYSSFQQFMSDQFQISTSKCRIKQSKLSLFNCISHTYIPLAEILSYNEQKWQSKQLAESQEKRQLMFDSL